VEDHSLAQIQSALLAGVFTVSDLVANYLDKAKLAKKHKPYIEIFTEELIAQARKLDERIKTERESLGQLFGLVISIKDNFCYQGHLATASSKILDGFVAPYSATVIERLVQADALIIGRTNCDELSMGSTNETSYYGPTKNALDANRVPGGSTGGGAVAVALKTCLLSLGSDTGGSIRQPAAFNGLLGYKPSYGTISRWGLIAYGSSFDTIGLIGHRVADIKAVMEVVSGPDTYDSSALDIPLSFEPNITTEANKIKIAYSSQLINDTSIASEVQASAQAFMAQLQATGYELVDVDLEYADYLVPAYYILTCAEASSNLSRFDGIRYGHRTAVPTDNYKQQMKLSRTEGFGSEVKRRILLGTYVLSEGYYDAYFSKAQKVRMLIKSRMEEILTQNDFFIMPTTTSLPWNLGESIDPIQVYLSDRYTVLANLCGIPAISFPVNNIAGNFPLGMQLMSLSKHDNNLLEITERLQAL